MNRYHTKQIRNVVLLGHGGCGKTSLVEAMAYLAGITNRIGNVSEGNTISDFDKEEVKREISINTSVVPVLWEEHKINILDTPGYFDFIGEVEEAVQAADAAIIVVSGKTGVEVGTQKAWEICEKYQLPRIIFVANMEDNNASFRQVVDDLTQLYGKKIAPFFMPIREKEKLVGYVNIVKKSGRLFKGLFDKEDCDIPDYLKDYFDNYREKLVEAVAETSEEYMERYFEGEEDKVSQALAKIMEEDQTIRVVNDFENRQSLLYGMGEQHLEIIASKLYNKYKVEIELMRPKVAFRETIKGSTQVQGKYKKQSGGHGQYGDVKLILEPSNDLSKPYVFEEKVFGGAVPKSFFPAVEKGIQESVKRGPVAAYPVVGVKATLIDGSYHPVDSSEMAFKTATIMAFKKGFLEAEPILLEPIVSLKVEIPEQYTGDIMGDLNKRRARVLGMTPIEGDRQMIEAEVPMMEIFDYSTKLRAMTGARGDYSYEFSRYEQAPIAIAQQEITQRADKVQRIDE